MSPAQKSNQAETPLSPALWNCHFFQFFNAICFQVILGAPIVLYAKSLNATSTQLGILASFAPLLVILQLPTAHFLHHFSYRKFVASGWGIRSIFIFAIAIIPLLDFLNPFQKLLAVMLSSLGFSIVRGISTTAFMPWTTEIVPAARRGKFLSRDVLFIHLGSLISLLSVAFILSHSMNGLEYSVIFIISAVAGVVCLFFILRIPDAIPGEAHRRSSQSVPWKEIINYPPFRILLIFNLSYALVIGSLGIFSIEYLREVPKFSPSSIILLSSFTFLGALVSLPLTANIVDRIGSKPVLRVSILLLACVIIGWFSIATQLLPPSPFIIGTLIFCSGISGANFQVANSKIIMATMPELGRNHFFALFMVFSGLGIGTSPILWGVLLDTLENYELQVGVLTFKRHGFYFCGVFLVALVAQYLVKYLHEAKSTTKLSREAMTIYGNLKRLGRIGIGR
ncbi:MAG: MFS transporter [Chthoniobacterales bacterium]